MVSSITCFDLGFGFCCEKHLSNCLLSISPSSNGPPDQDNKDVCKGGVDVLGELMLDLLTCVDIGLVESHFNIHVFNTCKTVW